MNYSSIIATGHYLPERIVSNFDLEHRLDTSDEWIQTRTGIRERHIAADDESSIDLAEKAARSALTQANIDPLSLDLIIVATSTADSIFPSDASALQYRLGCRTIPAFDMQAACSGFIYALVTADNFIRAGMAKRALVIGSDVCSRIVDWNDRNTAVLFGDGAGAVVLEASDAPGLLSSVLHSEGRQRDLLSVPLGAGSALCQRPQRQAYVQMRGSEVFKVAVQSLSQLVNELLEQAQLSASDIDYLVPHQANLRIIKATAEHLQLPMEKVITTVQHHANTSAASIPLALDYGIRQGTIQRGHKLLLEAFGAGFTWGGCVIQY